MKELKLCPFCGNKNTLNVSTAKELGYFGTDGFAVVCAATDGGCGASSAFYKTEQEAIAAWDTRTPTNGWINVNKGLPSSEYFVLVCLANRRISKGIRLSYSNNGIYSWDVMATHGIETRDDVTHWQPLPSPPYETAENE